MKSSLPKIFAATLFAICWFWGLHAQNDTTWVAQHYSKREVMIPMRDGAKLFTAIYTPRDSGVYPILLNRTPYSCAPYGENRYRPNMGPNKLLAEEKYIMVYQDVRGRYMSEGEFVDVRPHIDKKKKKQIDESSDTYDTVEWLVKNLKSNGKVGIYGISYPGFYAAAATPGGHPAIVAASPQAPVSDWFVGDDFHHNGALFLPHFFNFISSFGAPRPVPTTRSAPRFQHPTQDGYRFFLDMGPMRNVNLKYFGDSIAMWNDVTRHPDYDEWWQDRNLANHLSDVRCAVMTVGGWFDAENLYGALNVYRNMEAKNPGISNRLVMGPWVHGGWARNSGDRLGDISFGSNTSLHYQQEMELRFFNFHLKGKGADDLPEASVFETGANRWRSFDVWPPKEAAQQMFYLHAGGTLSNTPPSAGEAAFDEYVSDPAHPVPFMTSIQIGMAKEYMVADQRHAATRPDVLVYQTAPLTEALTFAGPLTMSLDASTTGTDCDFIIKVIDVFPNNAPNDPANAAGVQMGDYQMLVRGEPFRARYRKSFSQPEAMRPGEVEHIEFTLPDVLHTFQPGHRIMIQVQSTWFPLVDRNPQQFVNIYECGEEDFVKATMRVYHSAEKASCLKVGVMHQ
jgi:putative CocE/NonD family hydrolase